ncbi:hypothetical protein D3C72_2306040 [compost metagenome]
MRADRCALGQRKRHGFRHDRCVAGMEAAGDVGRPDHLHEFSVVADLVLAEALAHVGIEIDLWLHRVLLVDVSSAM